MAYIIPQEDILSPVILWLSPAQHKALAELGYDYSKAKGVTVKQYALTMNVSSRTVYEWLLKNKLTATKTLGGWRIFGPAS